MNNHLTEDQLNDYVNHALGDVQRTEVDHHLAMCTGCQMLLSEHDRVQRRIHYSVIARRTKVKPSLQLTYAAIAPRVKRPSQFMRWWWRFERPHSIALKITALAVVTMTLIILLKEFNLMGFDQSTADMVSTPSLIQTIPTTVPTATPVSMPTLALTATPAPLPIATLTPEVVWKIEGDPDQLKSPSGLALDKAADLYVVDASNNRIQKYDRNGKFLTQWGSYGHADGQFFFASWGDVTTDAQGDVYVADTSNARIQKFDGSGRFLTAWGAKGAGTSQFEKPISVAVDSQGNVYVADQVQSRVQKFDGNGRFLLQWRTPGTTTSQSYAPSAVTIDQQDFVYTIDEGFGTLQKFDHTGHFIARWSAKCGDDQFVSALDLTLDSSSNVYVTDYGSNRICKFDHNGQFLARWGSPGAGDGQFDRPYGIALDAQGNVYVVDSLNNRIQKFKEP